MSYIFWKLLVQRLILAINQFFWSILRGVRILLTHCNRIVHKIWHHVVHIRNMYLGSRKRMNGTKTICNFFTRLFFSKKSCGLNPLTPSLICIIFWRERDWNFDLICSLFFIAKPWLDYRLWYGIIKQTFPCGKFDWSSKQWHPVLILPCNHYKLRQSFHQDWVWTKNEASNDPGEG